MMWEDSRFNWFQSFLWHLSANVTAVSKQAGWGGFLGFIELQLVVPSGSLEVQYKPLLCVWLQLIYTSIINLFMVLIVPFDCTLLEVHILVMWWTMAYSCSFIWLKYLNKGHQIKTWREILFRIQCKTYHGPFSSLVF